MLDIIWTIISKYVPRLINGKLGKERPIILIVSFIAALVIYDQIVDIKDNVLRQTFHQFTGEEYLFQAGSRKGTYYKIGEKLHELANEDEQSLELIVNGGSSEILDKLLQNSYSFGLVQEDVLAKAEISQKAVRIIAPLYAERLHVLYRIDRWKQILGFEPSEPNKLIRTKEHLDPNIKKLLMTSKVRLATSEPKTGNVPLATHILEICGITPLKPVYKSFAETFEGLLETDLNQSKAVDVAFIVAGAPVSAIENELRKKGSERKIGIISIDSEVLQKLNLVTGLDYRLSRFMNIYHSDFNNVTTISSRAMLLASNNISDSAIGKMADLINKEIASTTGIPALKEFDFINRIKFSSSSTVSEKLRAGGVFVLIIALIFLALSIFLTWAISSYKRVNYSQEITKIYRDKLPSHIKLTKNNLIPKPVIEGNNQEIITEIVQGISDLLKLVITLREDYDSGGIIMTHQRYLLDNIYFIKKIFKTHLGQRMSQAILNHEIQITKEDIADYYTAGYLFAYDHNALLKHLASPVKQKSAPKVNLVE